MGSVGWDHQFSSVWTSSQTAWASLAGGVGFQEQAFQENKLLYDLALETT